MVCSRILEAEDADGHSQVSFKVGGEIQTRSRDVGGQQPEPVRKPGEAFGEKPRSVAQLGVRHDGRQVSGPTEKLESQVTLGQLLAIKEEGFLVEWDRVPKLE